MSNDLQGNDTGYACCLQLRRDTDTDPRFCSKLILDPCRFQVWRLWILKQGAEGEERRHIGFEDGLCVCVCVTYLCHACCRAAWLRV